MRKIQRVVARWLGLHKLADWYDLSLARNRALERRLAEARAVAGVPVPDPGSREAVAGARAGMAWRAVPLAGAFPLTAAGREDASFLYAVDDGSVVALVPAELLFTEEAAGEPPSGARRVDGLHLLRRTPHRDLYDNLLFGAGSCDRYIAWCEASFAGRPPPKYKPMHLLERRHDQLVWMQRGLADAGALFFADKPMRGRWNPARGLFNLVDGHHRATFLLLSGVRHAPVRMPRADYLAWRHDAAVPEAARRLAGIKGGVAYTPVANPFFMDAPASREAAHRSRLYHILDFLGERRLEGVRVLDVGSCLGYMAQHFYREGADVTGVEYEPGAAAVARELQTLLHTGFRQGVGGFEDFEADRPFDIGVMLTVFYHFITNRTGREDTAVRDRFLRQIDRHVNELLIWESGYIELADEEKRLLTENTKFKHYRRLAYTFGTGKARELGVFGVRPLD